MTKNKILHRRTKQSFVLALLTGLLWLNAGCSDEKQQTQRPASKGLPYELLVVMDEQVWDSPLRDSLQQMLEGPVPGLPQVEPLFRLLRLQSKHYTKTYAMLRNSLFVQLNDSLPAPELGIARNEYAVPQLMVRISAPDKASLGAYLSTRKQQIIDLLVNNELEYEAAGLRRKYSKTVAENARAHMKLDIRVPSDIQSVKKGKDFLWGSSDRLEKDLNLILYTYPMPETVDMFDTETYVRCRDSVLKVNIPGSSPDQWMTTADEGGSPLIEARQIRLDGGIALEARGLWEMHNGGIGGPFVALVRADTVARRMIVSEGFVYSPRTEKRNLIRRMEAALRTLKPVKTK